MSRLFPPVRAWKDKLIVSVILAAVVIGMKVFGISCPFYALSGFPCPTCGMTRAWLSVLSFDFEAAFAYHPLFWTVPLMYLCFLYDGRLFQKQWMNTALYLMLATAFAIHWAVALFT